MNYRGVVS